MEKFRIQPEFSVIWLQIAIETGLGSDLVVIGESLGWKPIYPVALASIWDLAIRRQKVEPCSVNSSLLPMRSSLEKKRSLFGLLYLPTTRNIMKLITQDPEANLLASRSKPQH